MPGHDRSTVPLFVPSAVPDSLAAETLQIGHREPKRRPHVAKILLLYKRNGVVAGAALR